MLWPMRIVFDNRPQRPYVNIHGSFISIKVGPPRPVENLLARECERPVAYQEAQQSVFARAQQQLTLAAPRSPFFV